MFWAAVENPDEPDLLKRSSSTGTGALPDGTFGNDQAVTVQEIQSINR